MNVKAMDAVAPRPSETEARLGVSLVAVEA